MPADKTTGARKALREATAACHERVDAAFSRFKLSDAEGYTRFLQAQAAAFGAVEPVLDRAAIVSDWQARKRLPLLAADLADLGAPMPEPLPAPDLVTEAELLGGLYVLEGSRLGGALLRRSVPEGLPARFLTPGDPLLWRSLIQLLDAGLLSSDEIAAAVRGAERVFGLFEQAGRRAFGENVTGG